MKEQNTDRSIFTLELKEKFKINENIINNPQFTKIINSLNFSADNYPKLINIRTYRLFSSNEPGIFVNSGEIATGYKTRENENLTYFLTCYDINKQKCYPGQKFTFTIGSFYPKYSFSYSNKNNHPYVRVEKKVNDTLREISFYTGNKNLLYAKDFVQKTNDNLYEHYYAFSNNGRVYLGNCNSTKSNETFLDIQKRNKTINVTAEILNENGPISNVANFIENLQLVEIENIVKSKNERLEFLNELKLNEKELGK